MFQAEPRQIEQFVRSLFVYADEESFVSFRAFDQFDRSKPPILIKGLKLGRDFVSLAHDAAKLAERIANLPQPAVFAPPVATFNNPNTARDQDLANGVALSVEVDNVNTVQARRLLESILGPVTVAVHSGGYWTDTDGEVFEKVHLHWRLSEPTRSPQEHAKLKEARWCAAALAGADKTAAPPCHPLRWPGSWNTKTKPRLAQIAAGNPASEIHLDEALERLQEALEAAGFKEGRANRKAGEPQAPMEDVQSALRCIPNEDVHWEEWNRIGMAAYAATGGSQDGLKTWSDWSAKSRKHEDLACSKRWDHYHKHPPTRIGAGTLFHLARQANGLWTKPSLFREPAKSDKPKRPAILHISEVESLPPPSWLIDGLIPRIGLTVVYGPPKSGKTFIVLSACLHVAAAKPWFGRKVESGAVVYIAGEGIGGLSTRLTAMRSRYEIAANIPFYVIPRALNFTDPKTPDELVALTRSVVPDGQPIAAVVIDTLARSMPGADENSAQEVGLVIAACDKIRDVLECAVIPIHHQGKDESRGLRGTSAIRGAVDASFRVKGTGKTASVHNEDQKDAETAPPMTFNMEKVELGLGRSSIVPVLAEEGPGQAGQAGHWDVPPMSRLLLQCLMELIAAGHGGHVPPAFNVPLGAYGATTDRLRVSFYEKLPAHEQDAKRKAFQRAIRSLSEGKLIGVKEPWIWSTHTKGESYASET